MHAAGVCGGDADFPLGVGRGDMSCSLYDLPLRSKLIVMLSVMSALFLVALDQTIIATALGAIVKEFDSFSSIGFIVTAYMVATTVTVPLAGKLSDMYGRKPLLLGGVAIFTIGSLLSGTSQSITWLIAWRVLQGIGGGIIMANAFTIIGDLFPINERAKWQGMFGAVFGMSSVIGPLLGGWLTDGAALLGMVTNWRWTFFINVPIGVVATLALVRYCPRIRHDKTHRPDYLGALLMTIALAALVLAVDNTEVVFRGLINSGVSVADVKAALLLLSVMSALGFVAVERRAAQPTLPLQFFGNATYRLIIAAGLLFGAAFLGAILYLTQFNQQVFGANASQAGVMLLPMVAGMMISSISTGQVVGRLGSYRRILTLGFAVATVGIVSLTALTSASSYLQEAISMSIVGLGFGMCLPILNLAVQNEFSQQDLGAATSSVQLFRGLGSTVGTALFAGVLTSGVVASIGDPANLPYIQTLRQSPQAQRLLAGELDADALLRLDRQREMIARLSGQQLAALPAPQRERVMSYIHQQQNDYHAVMLGAFNDSLRTIFLISAGLMAAGCVVTCFLPRKTLSPRR